MDSLAPAISVVIVCDYEAGLPGGFEDTRKTLRALAVQDLQEPAEFILCETEEFLPRLPDDFTRILPGLKILSVPGQTSYDLKNAGVEACSAGLIALLDADCIPQPDWLRLLLQAMRNHPEATAISGKTTYGGTGLLARTACLLARSYVDRGGEGPTSFISDNNAGFRKSAFLARPIPTHLGDFASHVQSEILQREGHLLWFDPSILVEHNFEGWSMERDIRRHRGRSTIQTRLNDGSLKYAWIARLGPVSIVPFIASKILAGWGDCLRCGPDYGVKWFEMPAVLATSVGLALLEIPGMWMAFQGTGYSETCFR